ncbi:hypothetical protein CF394_06025 [Tetzosporium hominis]|uniref:DUF2157 domain-containing protein n=1 Tax=Tetzosporium hominis TaxID=2020506 RepID=A0A264W421_9BACL|nr:DUF2157 domain-containing protein [Tetzosporium hominis]OZS78314.1 hypothetical protein CF394_06025 [Tetzosporium hominis]
MNDWQHKVREWQQAGLVDQATVDAITTYEQKQPQKRKIPLLLTIGLIFLTLAVFSFIAANWGAIPDVLKTVTFLAFMWVAYGIAVFSEKRKMGQPVLFYVAGYAFFIAAVLVTLQTFHLPVANSVLPWLAYLAALAHVYLIKHPVFSIASFIAGTLLLLSFLPDVGWIEWGAFVLITLAHFYYSQRSEANAFSFIHLFGAGLILWVLVEYESALWPIWTVFALTGLLFLSEQKKVVVQPLLQLVAAITGIGYLIARGETNLDLVDLTYLESGFLLAVGIALAVILWKWHRPVAWISILGLIGFLLYDETAIGLAILAEIVAFGYLILAQREGRSLRGGFLFFILIQFVIYFIYAWQRLDMALFFLLGAILLFVLAGIGWWLNRKKEGAAT